MLAACSGDPDVFTTVASKLPRSSVSGRKRAFAYILGSIVCGRHEHTLERESRAICRWGLRTTRRHFHPTQCFSTSHPQHIHSNRTTNKTGCCLPDEDIGSACLFDLHCHYRNFSAKSPYLDVLHYKACGYIRRTPFTHVVSMLPLSCSPITSQMLEHLSETCVRGNLIFAYAAKTGQAAMIEAVIAQLPLDEVCTRLNEPRAMMSGGRLPTFTYLTQY